MLDTVMVQFGISQLLCGVPGRAAAGAAVVTLDTLRLSHTPVHEDQQGRRRPKTGGASQGLLPESDLSTHTDRERARVGGRVGGWGWWLGLCSEAMQ
jgi:hypothetical protein